MIVLTALLGLVYPLVIAALALGVRLMPRPTRAAPAATPAPPKSGLC